MQPVHIIGQWLKFIISLRNHFLHDAGGNFKNEMQNLIMSNRCYRIQKIETFHITIEAVGLNGIITAVIYSQN